MDLQGDAFGLIGEAMLQSIVTGLIVTFWLWFFTRPHEPIKPEDFERQPGDW